MKIQPLIVRDAKLGFERCSIEDATHLKVQVKPLGSAQVRSVIVLLSPPVV